MRLTVVVLPLEFGEKMSWLVEAWEFDGSDNGLFETTGFVVISLRGLMPGLRMFVVLTSICCHKHILVVVTVAPALVDWALVLPARAPPLVASGMALLLVVVPGEEEVRLDMEERLGKEEVQLAMEEVWVAMEKVRLAVDMGPEGRLAMRVRRLAMRMRHVKLMISEMMSSKW